MSHRSIDQASPSSRSLAGAAVLGVAALLSACASAPAVHPPAPIDLGLPQVQAPLAPATVAHLDGEPWSTADAQP